MEPHLPSTASSSTFGDESKWTDALRMHEAIATVDPTPVNVGNGTDAMGEPEPPGVPSYASRSATRQYRTAPLEGAWQHAPCFHNGSAATLEDVVNTSDTRRSLGLTASEEADLVQYLKSLRATRTGPWRPPTSPRWPLSARELPG